MPSIDAYRQREKARCKNNAKSRALFPSATQRAVQNTAVQLQARTFPRRTDSETQRFDRDFLFTFKCFVISYRNYKNIPGEGLQKCSIMVPRSHNLASLDLRSFELSTGISRPDTGILVPTLSPRQCCKMYLW